MVVIYTAPEKEGLVHPTVEQVQAVIDAVENAQIEQAAAEELPEAFLNPAALKGSKAGKVKDSYYGSKTFTLKNGVTVWLFPTDHEKDRIIMNYSKDGGRSLLSDEEVFSFDSNIWSLYLQNSGIADFPATTVRKMLAGKQVSGSPYINEYTHGVSGTTTVKDLETALQLFYLYITAPRFDENEYNQGRSQIEAVLPNLMTQSNYKLNKALYDYVYDSPRRFMISDDVLAKASLSTLESAYKRLYADAAGARLVVVGDFNVDEIMPLICKYAGSIPAGKKAAKAEYRGDGISTADRLYDFNAQMATPMVTVLQVYNALKPYSIADEVANDALSYILDMLYTETLREDEGGTYGASSSDNVSTKPDERHMMQVVFQTNVESADKLRELAKSGFQGIAENGPTADQFDKAVKNLQKTTPENRQKNNYWASVIMRNARYGFDYDKEYEAAVNALTPADVQAAAQELLHGNMIEIVMRPE
jgi:zinc protease